MARPPEEPPFWGWVAVRLAGLLVAGLALVVFFREVMVPILRGDAAQHQKEHAPADLPGR
jgi:flagellar biosynthesis/type III secretory pathway M-ring protein FliF/YscJ